MKEFVKMMKKQPDSEIKDATGSRAISARSTKSVKSIKSIKSRYSQFEEIA